MNKMENINRTAKYFCKKKKCSCKCRLDWKLLHIYYVQISLDIPEQPSSRFDLIHQQASETGLQSSWYGVVIEVRGGPVCSLSYIIDALYYLSSSHPWLSYKQRSVFKYSLSDLEEKNVFGEPAVHADTGPKTSSQP